MSAQGSSPPGAGAGAGPVRGSAGPAPQTVDWERVAAALSEESQRLQHAVLEAAWRLRGGESGAARRVLDRALAEFVEEEPAGYGSGAVAAARVDDGVLRSLEVARAETDAARIMAAALAEELRQVVGEERCTCSSCRSRRTRLVEYDAWVAAR